MRGYLPMPYNRMTDQAVLNAHPNDEHKFQQWRKRVDRICVKHFMMPSSCLPDASWRDYFDAPLTPAEAVESAVEFCWAYEPGIKECYWGEKQ